MLSTLGSWIFAAALAVAEPSAAAPAVPADSGFARRDSTVLAMKFVPGGAIALAGVGRGQVREPAGVASDPFGRVWVSDAQLHRVQRFDREGALLGESGTLGSSAGEMRRPGSVAPLGAAHMAVLDRENRRVLAYDLFGRLDGTRLDLADSDTEALLGRVDPTALASDRGGELFIADPARERVLVFDAGGRLSRNVGGFGSRPGQFRGLEGVAIAPRGELVVTERLNARVQRLDVGGRPVVTFPLDLTPKDRGALPVAVDALGRVAVADETRGRLWLYDPAGRLLAKAADLGRPRALAFAADGSLLVAEASPARVRRFAVAPADQD